MCQIEFKFHNKSNVFCIDITDEDEHSPIGRFEWVTRKTASRYMTSGAIREVIEKFFVYLKH
jgi:hypothetical protein